MCYLEIPESDAPNVLILFQNETTQYQIGQYLAGKGLYLHESLITHSFSVGIISDSYWCHDGLKSDTETDVDCGGRICKARCNSNQKCLIDGDCTNEDCVDELCVAHQGVSWTWILAIVVLVIMIISAGFVIVRNRQYFSHHLEPKPAVESVVISDLELKVVTDPISIPPVSTESASTLPSSTIEEPTSLSAVSEEEKARIARAYARKHKKVRLEVAIPPPTSTDIEEPSVLSTERRLSQSHLEMAESNPPKETELHHLGKKHSNKHKKAVDRTLVHPMVTGPRRHRSKLDVCCKIELCNRNKIPYYWLQSCSVAVHDIIEAIYIILN